jgi:hypothetical protein
MRSGLLGAEKHANCVRADEGAGVHHLDAKRMKQESGAGLERGEENERRGEWWELERGKDTTHEWTGWQLVVLGGLWVAVALGGLWVAVALDGLWVAVAVGGLWVAVAVGGLWVAVAVGGLWMAYVALGGVWVAVALGAPSLSAAA